MNPHDHLDRDALMAHRILLDVQEGRANVLAENHVPHDMYHALWVANGGVFPLDYVNGDHWEAQAQASQEHHEDRTSEEKRIIRWVQDLIQDAVLQKASDIHIEPQAKTLSVRFRLDGHLKVVKQFGIEYKDEIVSRVKVLADLDIAEKRQPQDGKIHLPIQGKTIDFRVSTLPTGFGEKVVIRILDQSQVRLAIQALGMPTQVESAFHNVIRAPHGMVLVTGPTGSGKTTTLYAALNEIKSEQINILTIEDPIEYQIEGLNQIQVRPQIGLTFSQALRSFLRQDPNVIMVGEIRDLETAEMAVRASLTGHLVFSTLHTNSSVGAVPRLLDMGVEPFLLASSLKLSLAQRLVRRLCSACKTLDPQGLEIAKTYKLLEGQTPSFWTSRGCAVCNDSGFKGRLGVFEAFVLTESIREALPRRLSEAQLTKLQPDFRDIAHHGIELVLAGETSMAELLREVVLN
ncbi:MAG: type II/IV secretion system protein [Acidobacteria bacterium]|nr:type II/IV secretion system protein [Acidobacteriota bacterium]